MLQVVSPGSTRVNIETRCVCCGFGGLGVGGEDGFRGRRDIIAASEPIRLDIPESDVGAARGTSLYLAQYPAVVGGRGSHLLDIFPRLEPYRTHATPFSCT